MGEESEGVNPTPDQSEERPEIKLVACQKRASGAFFTCGGPQIGLESGGTTFTGQHVQVTHDNGTDVAEALVRYAGLTEGEAFDFVVSVVDSNRRLIYQVDEDFFDHLPDQAPVET